VATQGHFLENVIGVIPLSATIWSPAAILHELAYAVVAIFASCKLMPKAFRPISQFPESCKLVEPAVPEDKGGSSSLSQWLERSPLVPPPMCAMLATWLWYHVVYKRLSLDITSLNCTLLFLTLLLHRHIQRFTHAVQQGVVSSWAVIVLYHLYA